MSKLLEDVSRFDWVAGLARMVQAGKKELFICEIPPGRNANYVLRTLKRAGCNPSWYTSQRIGDDVYIYVDDEERAASVLAG